MMKVNDRQLLKRDGVPADRAQYCAWKNLVSAIPYPGFAGGLPARHLVLSMSQVTADGIFVEKASRIN